MTYANAAMLWHEILFTRAGCRSKKKYIVIQYCMFPPLTYVCGGFVSFLIYLHFTKHLIQLKVLYVKTYCGGNLKIVLHRVFRRTCVAS